MPQLKPLVGELTANPTFSRCNLFALRMLGNESGIAGCKFRKACCRFPRCCFVFTQSDPRMTSERRRKMAKNVICLWYDGTAEEAARFYAQTFPDSALTAVHRAPGDYPDGKEGQVLTVEFTVLGVACLGLNGGPAFKHSEAFSFQIVTEDQAETDRYWNAIVGNGGAESACGWCKDKWGLSWQITPRVLLEATTDSDRAAAKRAFEAMMKMKKIDIATIEAARRGPARP